MMSKKWVLPAVIAGILLLPVVGYIGLYLLAPGYTSHFDVVEANWGVVLPVEADWQEVYGNNQRGGFHGDGLSYYVYTCENSGEMGVLLPWETTQTPHYSCERWLDELQVPAVFRPDYTACGMKRMTKPGGDEVLFFWDHVKRTLYIAESFQ